MPETTKQLDEDLMDSLTSISPDAREIVFEGSDPDLSDIEEGNVLSMGVGEKTPHGLLRKVVRIERSGTSTTLVTDQATIEDAVEEGRVEYKQIISDPLKIMQIDGK